MRYCPSNDFDTVGPNGLPVKTRDLSQERQKPEDSPVADQPLTCVKGPRHDPPMRNSSPEWGLKEKHEDVHRETVDKKTSK